MAGGAEAALQAGADEIEAMNLPAAPGDLVIDLGAGFGMHSIPLARTGARVIAIDTSAELLQTLTELGGDLPITAIKTICWHFAVTSPTRLRPSCVWETRLLICPRSMASRASYPHLLPRVRARGPLSQAAVVTGATDSDLAVTRV
jgi:hypothetical protein